MAYHVSKARFGELVQQALQELPEQFRDFLESVPVQIEDRPSKKLLREMELEDDALVFGLYQGPSLMDCSEIEGRFTPSPNHILILGRPRAGR
jgi:predicted Zn-dependent protease with MMP-like domain